MPPISALALERIDTYLSSFFFSEVPSTRNSKFSPFKSRARAQEGNSSRPGSSPTPLRKSPISYLKSIAY